MNVGGHCSVHGRWENAVCLDLFHSDARMGAWTWPLRTVGPQKSLGPWRRRAGCPTTLGGEGLLLLPGYADNTEDARQMMLDLVAPQTLQ